MTEIKFEDLRPEHLHGISDVFATDGVEKIKVGPSRLARFVSQDSDGELRKVLCIRVNSLDNDTVAEVESKIREVRKLIGDSLESDKLPN